MKTTKLLIPAIALLLFLFTPLVALKVRPGVYEGGRSRDAASRALRNSSSAALILGEMRTSMSDVIFLKSERYLHGGVAYEPHLAMEELSAEAEAAKIDSNLAGEDDHDHAEHEAHDDHDDHEGEPRLDDAGGAPTVIREQERDFRGFIGMLEREIKPFLDPDEPHIQTDGSELLPWLRVMTIADPQSIRGYMAGGWWLKHYDREEAINLLQEGIEHNPTGFQLYHMTGQVYVQQAQDLRSEAGADNETRVTELLRTARDYFVRAAEEGLKQRPEDWVWTEVYADEWHDYREEDLRAAMRTAVILEGRVGDREKAIKLGEYYLSKIGDDRILRENMEDLRSGETQ